MLQLSKKIWFYIICGAFILLNAVFLSLERFELLIVPMFAVLAYLVLFKLDAFFKIIIFLVPLSVSLVELGIDIGVGMSLPTEPLLFGALLLFLLKLFHEGGFDEKIIKHPITYLILIGLIWMAITTISSVRPIVSIKYLVGRMWFLAVFYFIATQVFKEKKNIIQFFWLYISGLTLILVYTLTLHAQSGFDQKTANWIMSPFFDDHTSYGAAIAFFMPFLTYKLFDNRIHGVKRLLLFFLYGLWIFALIMSYTRAAWLSLVGSLAVFLILKLKINWGLITSGAIASVIILVLSWDNIIVSLEDNKTDSSTNLKKHVASMSNVSSDASNRERLNRWNSAFEMWKEKPIFGWGPGTYAFEYAPYQKSSDKTIISTNSGDMGNAHSEYLGPLAESGIVGSLTMVMLIIVVFVKGVQVYKKIQDKELRNLIMMAFLGLISYFIHGGLNNFLDTDKISAPFWGMIAMLVVAEQYFIPKEQEQLIAKD
jgi:O-antigen ligase